MDMSQTIIELKFYIRRHERGY